MSRGLKIAAGLLILVMDIAAFAAPIPNSICLPKGTWACIEQGTRMCNWQKTTCDGACTTCLGNDTVPDKMCFMNEGGSCEPLADYICGARFDNGVCTMVSGSCVCQRNLVPTPPESDGECRFSSCN